ncbi:hypothetical protein B7463_g8867, partial [Scytalidium lignicola]
MTYGSRDWQKWVLEEEEALPLLKHAYDVGINTLDIADLYSNGCSEEIIGKALQNYDIPHENVIILTKCQYGISRFGELQLSVFAITVNDGQMMPAWKFQLLQNLAKKNEWHKFIRMQNYYNLLYREEKLQEGKTNKAIITAVEEVAKARGVSMAVVAIA